MSLGLGSAAQAVPLTFTYTSSPVDWSRIEPWEYDYLANSHYRWNVGLPLYYAQVVVETDCLIAAQGLSCAPLTGAAWGDSAPFSLAYGTPVNGASVVATSGFSEQRLTHASFDVDGQGRVTNWDFRGAEFGSVGDFILSSNGDRWAGESFATDDPSGRYCRDVEGSEHVLGTPYCANGARAGSSISLRIDMEPGNWSVTTADGTPFAIVPGVPLPGGLPMVLSGFGALAALRWRTRSSTAE